MAAEWAHLRPLVSALERGGNPVVGGGFRVVEGGYECLMQQPLDFVLLHDAVSDEDQDIHLAESSDMVWCSHCWGSIIGSNRAAEVRSDRLVD